MALSKKYADWEFQNPIKVRVYKFTLIDRFFILHQINYLCIYRDVVWSALRAF